MSLALDRMRAKLRKGLGLDPTEMDNDEADELLNLSLWEIADRFHFKEKECYVTTSLVVGQRSYAIPNDLDGLQSLAIIDDEQTHKLRRMDPDLYDEIRDDDDDAQGQPEWYMRVDDGIYLHPIPDETYTIQIFLWRTISSLEDGVVTEPNLPRNWHELVVEGAITRGHYYNQDYNLAREASNFQVGKLRQAVSTQAKEERDSRYAGLRVQYDDPDGRAP